MGDALFIGSCSGTFYALDRHRGQPIWSYDATFDSSAPNFHGDALFAGDLVVVGTDGRHTGFLYGFDRATGEVRWLTEAAGGFPSDARTRGSRVYAATVSGEIRCLDLATGETQWSAGGVEGERLLSSAVAIVGDRVVANLPSGAVLALDADSGAAIWKAQLPGRLNTPALSVGDEICVGDLEGRIHRLSSEDGKLLGAFEGQGPVYGSLQSAENCLLALRIDDTLDCLDPRLGTARWSRKTESTWSSFEPLVLDGLVIAGTEAGEIHGFRLADGTTAWTHRVEGEIKGLGSHEGVLYVGTREGRVYALRVPELAARISEQSP